MTHMHDITHNNRIKSNILILNSIIKQIDKVAKYVGNIILHKTSKYKFQKQNTEEQNRAQCRRMEQQPSTEQQLIEQLVSVCLRREGGAVHSCRRREAVRRHRWSDAVACSWSVVYCCSLFAGEKTGNSVFPLFVFASCVFLEEGFKRFMLFFLSTMAEHFNF